MAFSYNEALISQGIVDELNRQMTEAAEPIIQEALKRMETEMRARMAAALISRIQSNFSMERYGYDLRITVHQALPKPGGGNA